MVKLLILVERHRKFSEIFGTSCKVVQNSLPKFPNGKLVYRLHSPIVAIAVKLCARCTKLKAARASATNVARATLRKLSTGFLFKDVRANCFCASLLRTQMHTPRHTRARALSNKMRNDRAKGHCYSFAWI